MSTPGAAVAAMRRRRVMNDGRAEPCGVLVVDKPSGWTSFDVIGKLRRLYGTRRIGHTGTLDPMATGVLVVLVGRAAKAAEYVTVHDKSYLAGLRLGVTTDTEDTSGEVISRYEEALPSDDEVLRVSAGFVGEIMQTPPMYSALKVNGRKLCDIARGGGAVERAARPITVHSLAVAPRAAAGNYTLTVECSAGTYIRTLCADIGAALGCGGVMSDLRRLSVGNFTLAGVHTMEEIEAMEDTERRGLLLPVETLFSELPAVDLPPFFERLFRSGCEIYQKKIGTHHPVGARLRVCRADGGFFAIGEVREYEAGSAIRSLKLFEL